MEIKAKSTKLDDLREYLIKERLRLKAEIDATEITGMEQAGYGNHMADDATEVFEQAKRLALRQGLETRLADVEAAIEKMRLGTYGMCDNCSKAIDPARLRAMPSAALCFSCQVHVEERKSPNWRKSR